jgi:hypothetical protein
MGCLISFAQLREATICPSVLEAVSINPLEADIDVELEGMRKTYCI